jgi:hypothetical protein
MRAQFRVKYEGLYADQHLLPAHEGTMSIHGIARSLTLVTTYLSTGKVRKHAPFESPVGLFLKPARAGSFDTIYQLVAHPDLKVVIGDLTIGVSAALIYDAIRVVFSRVTGTAAEPQTKSAERLFRQRPGDIAALEDAVEPSLREAHRVIGTGSNNIVIFGNHNQIVFDRGTKDYITQSIMSEELESKEVSIASYHANNKSGRVYDFEFSRTIPFSLSSRAPKASALAIARSLTQYVGGQESKVLITYRKILAPDGKVKKYIIERATKPVSQD